MRRCLRGSTPGRVEGAAVAAAGAGVVAAAAGAEGVEAAAGSEKARSESGWAPSRHFNEQKNEKDNTIS